MAIFGWVGWGCLLRFLAVLKKIICNFVGVMAEQATPAASAQRRLNDYLRQEGGRATPERCAILDVALAMKGHFTAEELHEQIGKGSMPIARSTVFATVDLLVKANILQARVLGGRRVFEKTSSPHHHTICTDCGRIKDLRDPHIDSFLKRRTYSAFNPDEFELIITGTCSACARKKRKNK